MCHYVSVTASFSTYTLIYIIFLAFFFFFFFNDTATTEIYTLSLHDALPISDRPGMARGPTDHRVHSTRAVRRGADHGARSEEHTSELQSLRHLVCRLLLEKKKKKKMIKLSR